MDVETLFARDLNGCSTAESKCLQTIARQSPADWFEVLDTYGAEVLRALQDRRLIIRSGDRLNVYWDIFREYILTGTVRSIPFTYLCSSPSIGALLSVAARLSPDAATSCSELSQHSGLSAKTVGNVVHDLIMFGIASGRPSVVRLGSRMNGCDEVRVLERLRSVLKRHALMKWLSSLPEGTIVTVEDLIAGLKAVNPAARHTHDTWVNYAERLGPWFVATGLLEMGRNRWILRDLGKVAVPSRRGSRFRIGAFRGDAPPLRVVQALVWLAEAGGRSSRELAASPYRNAVHVLDRLELATRDDDGNYSAVNDISDFETAARLVWDAAKTEESLRLVHELFEKQPSSRGRDVGEYVGRMDGQSWSESSRLRTGNALILWAAWVAARSVNGKIPPPPGPRVKVETMAKQLPSLFAK